MIVHNYYYINRGVAYVKRGDAKNWTKFVCKECHLIIIF